MRLKAEVTSFGCKVENLHHGQDRLKEVAHRFLVEMEEAGIAKAEQVLALVEAIERRVAEARAYVASAARDLEARLKAGLSSSAYKALEARAALEGLKKA